MSTNNKSWLSVYFYRTGSWKSFLVEGIKPFVESVLYEGIAEQFFFIRYGERGPHIRLRLKGESGTIEQTLKPRLKTYFLDYFVTNPTHRVEPSSVNDLPKKQMWFPNDSIQFIKYKPEVTRYGGPKGLLISEKQFEASSRAVLSILAEHDTWDYQRALGSAIQLHLVFSFALGLDLEEAKQFFTYIYAFKPMLLSNEAQKHKEDVTKIFEEKFNQQKDVLVPYHQNMWLALETNSTFEQTWLNEWNETMNNIGAEWKQAQEQRQLIYPDFHIYDDGHVGSINTNYKMWSIWASNIHMTNNRLGILNQDEAYLGYLIKRSLESLEAK
ncbi:MAG TPA: hypothetical protein EYH05_15605 [Anaerolineae bacterium]|nr:hypothetical protein [Anaerolineae bacterium]